jgi:hypothetical protein
VRFKSQFVVHFHRFWAAKRERKMLSILKEGGSTAYCHFVAAEEIESLRNRYPFDKNIHKIYSAFLTDFCGDSKPINWDLPDPLFAQMSILNPRFLKFCEEFDPPVFEFDPQSRSVSSPSVRPSKRMISPFPLLGFILGFIGFLTFFFSAEPRQNLIESNYAALSHQTQESLAVLENLSRWSIPSRWAFANTSADAALNVCMTEFPEQLQALITWFDGTGRMRESLEWQILGTYRFFNSHFERKDGICETVADFSHAVDRAGSEHLTEFSDQITELTLVFDLVKREIESKFYIARFAFIIFGGIAIGTLINLIGTWIRLILVMKNEGNPFSSEPNIVSGNTESWLWLPSVLIIGAALIGFVGLITIVYPPIYVRSVYQSGIVDDAVSFLPQLSAVSQLLSLLFRAIRGGGSSGLDRIAVTFAAGGSKFLNIYNDPISIPFWENYSTATMSDLMNTLVDSGSRSWFSGLCRVSFSSVVLFAKSVVEEIFVPDIDELVAMRCSSAFPFLGIAIVVHGFFFVVFYGWEKGLRRGLNALFHLPADYIEKNKNSDLSENGVTFPNTVLVVSYIAKTDQIYSISESCEFY